MTRRWRDTTLFKVTTGEFALALTPRDGSFSRGIVSGQPLSRHVESLGVNLGKRNVALSLSAFGFRRAMRVAVH